MPAQKRHPDPFRPIELVVRIVLGVVVAGLMLMTTVALDRVAQGKPADVSSGQIGERYSTCTDLPLAPAGLTVGWTGNGEAESVEHAAPGTRAMSSGLSLCTPDTSLLTQILASGRNLVDDAMGLGSLVLILVVIRLARRRGLFNPSTAAAVRRLGWFLLAGSILGPLVGAWSQWAFVHRFAPDYSLVGALLSPGIMWTVLIVGAGVLTYARILRVAVPLQEDAELTV